MYLISLDVLEVVLSLLAMCTLIFSIYLNISGELAYRIIVVCEFFEEKGKKKGLGNIRKDILQQIGLVIKLT